MAEPRFIPGIAWLAIFLSGCGSTITTRIQLEAASPVPAAVLSHAQINRDVREMKRAAGMRINLRESDAALHELVRSSGTDPERLVQAAEFALDRAINSPKSQRQQRAGFAFAACEIAYQSLRDSGVSASGWLTRSATRRALAIYNTSLAIFISKYSRALARGNTTLNVPTPFGPGTVAARYSPQSRYRPGYFDDLIPADFIKIAGFKKRVRVEGLGVPLVGVRARAADRKTELLFQPPDRGTYVALGCFAKFQPNRDGVPRMQIAISDLDRTAKMRIAGESIPLAGDFTAPLALSFGGINDLMLGIRAILNVGASADYNGIYLIEPFDPRRIPVLLLHGLTSSPLVWRNVATDAMQNPLIRENFQFWYAFYSTGVPVPQSAALIREKIALIRRSGDPHGTSLASKNIVIVGYSMGGLIARVLATDMGDRLWRAVSKKPFDEVKLQPDDREELRQWIFWKPVPGVREVIFLATPHRGTRMADASFAQLGRRLVGLPASLVRFQARAFSALSDALENVNVSKRSFTGIDSLSPEAPIYKAFERAPFAPGLTYHSVIGDRGRGDSPKSSDGIVGYWSSHLDGAESELIVPTGHDVQTHSKTETEIQRILLHYLGSFDEK